MFGFQRRRVARFEWETLLPKLGAFPHRSHTEDTLKLPLIRWITYLEAKGYLAKVLNG
jgi:hypothetical protein